MIGKENLGEKPLPVTEVKRLLEKRKKEGELTYEQKVSLEYAQEFGKAAQTKVSKAIEDLASQGIDERIAVQIVNVQPKTKEEVKLIFEKVRSRISEDQVKKILDIVASLE